MAALLFVILILLPVTALAEPVRDSSVLSLQPGRTELLTISEVLARIELTHPLLRASGVERTQARAKILKALGAWEPTFKNRTEVDRYQSWNFLAFVNETTGGFNDSTIEVGHPWGFRVHGGIRNGFGDRTNQGAHALMANDGLLFWHNQQILVGGEAHLLRGLMMNEEFADFQKAELAGPQAEIHIAQKRQDLYLAGAIQYWDWQVAVKQAEVQKQNLAVAEARAVQVEGQAKAGKVALLDAVEINQEVQRRREAAIAAQRQMEYEQYKLSLFLWENGEPVTPRPEWAPEFTGETPLPTEEEITAAKVSAKEDRPEVRDLYIQAKMNNIDVKLAKNYLLPKFDLKGGQMEAGSDWNLGVGQVSIDVDNWVSAIVRARERVRAAAEAYRLAKTLEEGERTRFHMGATSILFVNKREKNAVEAAYELYRAQYDYVLARGGLLYAKGALSKPVANEVLAKYGDPSKAAGLHGHKVKGRD
ncbi:MAG: TolC family protein [Nitrospira sp.]|nr:TolC family protein [Nitrospira sp.]